MAARALSIHMGSEAAQAIARNGWTPELFSLLLGASGGPKWFVLGQLDRFLFGDFLQRSTHPLATLGSSIGSWRNACLTQADPVAAIERMEQGYLYQEYDSEKPSAAQISLVSQGILESMLGADGRAQLVHHPRITSHIVTARGRGPAASSSTPMLATGMGAAALGNAVSRKLLKHHFQRVVFHSGEAPAPGLSLLDFNTQYCSLREDNLLQSLHASGAIPFVLTGERNIPGAPKGQYWDGGIIDYHFDLEQYQGDGLLLYPHFRAGIVPGWFDKFLPWRQGAIDEAKRLVLLCPSEAFTASLPHGKIPDRSDFTRMKPEQRIAYWEQCVAASAVLAEEFAELVDGRDPLAGVSVY
jgi:hypothetical protein